MLSGSTVAILARPKLPGPKLNNFNDFSSHPPSVKGVLYDREKMEADFEPEDKYRFVCRLAICNFL